MKGIARKALWRAWEAAVGAHTSLQGRVSVPEEKMTILSAAAAMLWSERSFTRTYQP